MTHRGQRESPSYQGIQGRKGQAEKGCNAFESPGYTGIKGHIHRGRKGHSRGIQRHCRTGEQSHRRQGRGTRRTGHRLESTLVSTCSVDYTLILCACCINGSEKSPGQYFCHLCNVHKYRDRERASGFTSCMYAEIGAGAQVSTGGRAATCQIQMDRQISRPRH